MGTCNSSCAVSGLPLKAKDKVRYFLLTQNPYIEMRSREELHGSWFPRTIPLRAEYNDYDSVEEVETGPVQALWLEGFKKDLIEKGWGDNSHHDLSTSKDMTFDALLKAVREGRVYVGQSLQRVSQTKLSVEELERLDELKEKELPTLQRVLSILKEKNQPLYEGTNGPDGYMVDDVQYGIVRVRWHGWGSPPGSDEARLAELLPFLTAYTAVIAAGSGNYADRADLLVMVKPNDKRVPGPFHAVETTQELLVSQAMIREDVWQALLAISTKADEFKKDTHTLFESCLEQVLDYRRLEENLSTLDIPTELKKSVTDLGSYLNLKLHFAGGSSPAGAWLRDAIPFTVGLGENLKMMLSWCLEDKIAPEQWNPWLDAIAEFACVHDVLRHTSYWWRPSYRVGPQFGDFRRAEKINSAVAEIAKRVADEEDAEAAQ